MKIFLLSNVPAGNSPVFGDSSTDFNLGDKIITYNLTSGEKYDVKIIVYPSKAMVLDTIVEVR